MKKISLRVFLFLCFQHSILSAFSQVISSSEIDSLVEKTLKTFEVPGIAVAVIKDGKVIHSKGYGVRSLKTMQKVDENTLYGIASNSKAFTAAALGMLVDEKKIKWNDKVRDYIPEFKMYNPYVTEEFTIKDLLTHRSGLGLGAGDLMIFPDSNNFSVADIIHNMRYLKPTSSFRTQYDYDNQLYIIAGEVIKRVSGLSWEDFIDTRFLKPLKMIKSAPSFSRLADKSNVVEPHAKVEGILKPIRRDWDNDANAAGGIYSNINDLSKWVTTLLNKGKYDTNKQLVSEEVLEELWTPQTIIPIRGTNAYNTHFASYGLGFFLADVKGYKQASHTGGLAGIVTQITLIPEISLGIIVLTNQQVGQAFTTITNTIKDSYLGVKGIDRLQENKDRFLKAQDNAKSITDAIWKTVENNQKNNLKIDNKAFTRTYHDDWLGDAVISEKNGKLWFESKRSFLLSGEMFPYKGNTFVVKFTDRSMDADAFVIFNLDSEGKAIGFKMNAISPATDFSFDFQDLDFK